MGCTYRFSDSFSKTWTVKNFALIEGTPEVGGQHTANNLQAWSQWVGFLTVSYSCAQLKSSFHRP
jgi:hypothetical protein